MQMKTVAGVMFVSILMSNAYGAQCPEASTIKQAGDGFTATGPNGTNLSVNVYPEDATSEQVQTLKFTAAAIKEGSVICRYEGSDDLGASLKYGTATTGDSDKWKENACTTADNNTAACSFK